MKLKRDEVLPEEDTSRPIEKASLRLMLNDCKRCGRYLYVYMMPSGEFSYLCGRCFKETR